MHTRTPELTIFRDHRAEDAKARLGVHPLGSFFDAHRADQQVQTYVTALQETEHGSVPVGAVAAIHQNVISDGVLHVTGIAGEDEAVVEPMVREVLHAAEILGSGVLARTVELTAQQRHVFVESFGAVAVQTGQGEELRITV